MTNSRRRAESVAPPTQNAHLVPARRKKGACPLEDRKLVGRGAGEIRVRNLWRSRFALATIAWSALFAAVHLYWAAGGRSGLGEDAQEADAALSTAWFAAYNAGVTALAIVGGGIAARIGARPSRSRWGRRLAGIGGAVLLVRGAIGSTGLLVDAVSGGVGDVPAILVAIEPAFLVGGAVYLTVAGASTCRAVGWLRARAPRRA